MTLRGSFSEVPLAEILQLATNSGNTAVLEVKSGERSAWIGIADGEVVRIARSDVSLDRDDLQAAKKALLDIFEWRDGEFELDAFADPRKPWNGPEGVALDPPVHPQALSLEAARLHDERRRSNQRKTPLTDSGSEIPMGEVVAVAMASGNTSVLKVWSNHGSAWIGMEAGEVVRLAGSGLPPVTGDAEQCEHGLRSEAARALVGVCGWDSGGFELDVFARPGESWEGPDGITVDPPLSHREILRAARQPTPLAAARSAPAQAEPIPERESPAPTPVCAVIAMGTDLQFLEELRMTIPEEQMRIHFHQFPEDGIRRVGHYLVKGAVPLVVLDSQREESGGPSWQGVVDRIQALSERVCIVRVTRERLRAALRPFLEVPSPETQRNGVSVSES